MVRFGASTAAPKIAYKAGKGITRSREEREEELISQSRKERQEKNLSSLIPTYSNICGNLRLSYSYLATCFGGVPELCMTLIFRPLEIGIGIGIGFLADCFDIDTDCDHQDRLGRSKASLAGYAKIWNTILTRY